MTLPSYVQERPANMSAASFEPMFIDGGAGHIYAALHRPMRLGFTSAVLVVPPLFHEQPRSRRFITEVANCLADIGLPALRFDFLGTGDSSGKEADVDFASMSRDIDCVADALRELVQVRDLAVLAFRAGALPAHSWIAGGGKVNGVVFWDPVTNGRRWLEELERQDRAERTSVDRYPLRNWPLLVSDQQLMGYTVGERLREDIRSADFEGDGLSQRRDYREIVRSCVQDGSATHAESRITLPDGTPSFGDGTRMDEALFMSPEIQEIVRRIGAEVREMGQAK